jgi:hypothetical protein
MAQPPNPAPQQQASDADYPKVLYHDDGRHMVVNNQEQQKALGQGWSDKHDPEKHGAAMRKQAGAVAETILPVTRTRAESV